MAITQELIDAKRKNMSRAKFYVWFKQYALEKYGVNILSINYENQLNSDMWEAWQAAISQHKAVQDGWVDRNAAWIDSSFEVSSEGTICAGISTPYWGHIIQCYGNTEQEAQELCKTVFNALAAAPSDSKALVESEPVAEVRYSSHPARDYVIVWIGKDKPELDAKLYLHPTPADTVKQDAPNTPSDGDRLECAPASHNWKYIGEEKGSVCTICGATVPF